MPRNIEARELCAVLLMLTTITACQPGSGENLNEQGLPEQSSNDEGNDDEQGGDEQGGDSEATLSTLQDTVFTPICSRCHQGSNAPQGLRLDSEDNSFDFLVSQASNERPELLRVEPGSPDNSYLIMKVEGDPSIIGGRMPLGGTALPSASISLMRDWISNGAPRSGTGENATTVSQVQATQNALDIRFSRALEESVLERPVIEARISAEDLVETEVIPGLQFVQSDAQTLRVLAPIPSGQNLHISFNTVTSPGLYAEDGLLIDGDGNGWAGGEYTYQWKRNELGQD